RARRGGAVGEPGQPLAPPGGVQPGRRPREPLDLLGAAPERAHAVLLLALAVELDEVGELVERDRDVAVRQPAHDSYFFSSLCKYFRSIPPARAACEMLPPARQEPGHVTPLEALLLP